MARFKVKERTTVPLSAIGWKAIGMGFLFALALTLVVSAVLAAVIAATSLTEFTISGATYYLALLTVAAGGAYGARRATSMGWLHGGLVGVLYAVVVGLLGGLIFPGGLLAAQIGNRLLIAFAAGAIGGMVGVNV